jgi:REP element-mobilizing transposase RayT
MQRFGYQRKLRTGRRSGVGVAYLVTFSTYERCPLFFDLYLGRVVVRALRFCDSQRWTQTWAFVVMPDHVHWMFRLEVDRSLSAVVGSLKKFSARKINERRCSAGAVWQAGFHDHAMRREEDVASAARYIVRNPIRSGLVRRVGDYSLWDAVWVT